MAALPTPQHSTAQAILGWWEANADNGHRAHLGASLIGHPCARHLWLTFRWAKVAAFEGRMLRLFDTGKREEPRVIEELRGIGCDVWADDGSGQYRVSTHGGHFGGSMDGVVRGLLEAPKTAHVLEIKTHNSKSFDKLLKVGVREHKPMHFAQMQTYMHLAELERALYYAVNKDTDAVYLERVEYDKAFAEQLMQKALAVITAAEPPLRLSDDPAYFECKYCSHYELCHGPEVAEVNCRTCAHSTPLLNADPGAWRCEAGRREIQRSRDAHACHRFIPILLERHAKPVDSDGNSVTYEHKAGGQFSNGPRPGFSSTEIEACGCSAVLTDGDVAKLCEQFPTAKVVA